MSDDEKELWHKISESVKPLSKDQMRKSLKGNMDHSKETPKTPTKQQPKNTQAKPQAQKTQKNNKTPEFFDPKSHAGIDKNTYARLKRGQIPTEATLDLHGMRQHEAFSALEQFVLANHAQGKRCVLVITGKGIKNFSGERQTRGVIRQSIGQWITEATLKDKVLKLVPAAPKDGGEGAFYVYLKRPK